MAFDTIVGYSFNADIYCLDCTREYVEEHLRNLDDYERKGLEDLSFHQIIEDKLIADFNDNDLHPIFESDEQINEAIYCLHTENGKFEPILVKEPNYWDNEFINEKVFELKEELKPFFEDLEKIGSSVFDCSRVWDFEKELYLDDNSFQDQLFDELQEEYNCVIETYSVDMGSYVVIHNDFYIDENGNTHQKSITE